MEDSSFAILPENQIALACHQSKYMILYDSTNKVEPNMERYQWRDDDQGFVQIFYSNCREEIMIFDREKQLICCCDLSGNFLYNMSLKSGDECFVEEVFITENKIALLEGNQDNQFNVMVATILG